MRRLAVASSVLLAMVVALAVAVYLLFLAGSGDRAASTVPADTAVYLQAYLQPSSGQKMKLSGLIGRLRGFSDAAALDEKIHQIAQRLLGDIGIDYAADLRPWLGNEIAVAATPSSKAGAPPELLLIVAVRDAASARSDVPRLMGGAGRTFEAESYRGVQLMVSEDRSYALLPDLLVVAESSGRLRSAIDAETNAAPSLADLPAFNSAMGTLPVDRLASVYVDLERLAGVSSGAGVAGYRTAALALTAAGDGLHLDGSVPLTAHQAGEASRAAFALGGRPSTLVGWMSRDASAELVVFGLQQTIAGLESQLADNPAFAPAGDALNQLRAVAALGLGINADRDLLPLFDGEVALVVGTADLRDLGGLLLLRPTDSAAAEASLNRMQEALRGRGIGTTKTQADDTVITSLSVPQVGPLAYAVSDGVILLGRDAADVAAAIEAHASGAALADDPLYTAPFELIGDHVGNEIWADVPSVADAAAGIFDPGTELRDILHQIGQVAIVASAGKDQLEIHAVLTVR